MTHYFGPPVNLAKVIRRAHNAGSFGYRMSFDTTDVPEEGELSASIVVQYTTPRNPVLYDETVTFRVYSGGKSNAARDLVLDAAGELLTWLMNLPADMSNPIDSVRITQAPAIEPEPDFDRTAARLTVEITTIHKKGNNQ